MRIGIVGAVLALAGVALAARQGTSSFRTEINYVELHVSVTTGPGARVDGLTRDDFLVTERGVPQTIEAVDEVHLPPPSASESGRVDASIFDNATVASGRLYTIVVDTGHLDGSAKLRIRRQMSMFVDKFLAPGDLAAVVTLGARPHATSFTSNKSLLRAALGLQGLQIGGPGEEAPTPATGGGKFGSDVDDSVSEELAGFVAAEKDRDATNTVRGFSAIEQIAKFLGGLDGRRKALI